MHELPHALFSDTVRWARLGRAKPLGHVARSQIVLGSGIVRIWSFKLVAALLATTIVELISPCTSQLTP